MIKKIIMGVVLLMCLGFFIGCEDSFAKDCVSVSIKAEYKDTFLSENFTISDFDWKNIERIEYGKWHSVEPETGFLTIYLKKHGKKQVNNAVKYFNTLDFVSVAEKIGISKIY